MDERFAQSFIHAPAPRLARWRGLSAHVVLGRRLLPYCYWHAFGLDSILSPLAGHPGPLDLAALQAAVHICSSTFPRFAVPSSALRLRACLLQYRFGRAFLRELRRFLVYRDDYSAGPEYLETEGSRACATPWYLFSVERLRLQNPRLSEREAWMMPIGRGGWRIAGRAEAAGEELNLMTPQLRTALRGVGHNV